MRRLNALVLLPVFLMAAALVLLVVLAFFAEPASAQLANSYPNDVGICNDPQVVWCEQFDDTLAAVLTRWTGTSATSDSSVTGSVGQSNGSTQMSLVTDTPLGTGKSLQTRVTGGTFNSVQLSRDFAAVCPSPCNELWFRAYVKYSGPQPHHHAGMWIIGQNPKSAFLPSTNCDDTLPISDPSSCAALLAGNTVFYIGAEPGSANTPPSWDLYTGWMDMKNSPTFGPCTQTVGSRCFLGNTFVPDTVTMTFGVWHHIEVHVKMNTIGLSDGELQAWVDGQEVINLTQALHGDYGGGGAAQNIWVSNPASPNTFPGFKWRSATTLEIAKMWLNHFSDQVAPGVTQDLLYDNIVVAKTRVGPIFTGTPQTQQLFVRFQDTQADGTNQETGFKVNRKAGTNGIWVPFATPGPSAGTGATVTVQDTAAPYPTACYQVAATNSAGDSSLLGGNAGVCFTVTTPPTAPCCLLGCVGVGCTPQ